MSNHRWAAAADAAALRATEERAVADVTQQAVGDGRWLLRTRHGHVIGCIERRTGIGPHGRRERITLDGARFPVQSFEVAMFCAALAFLGADAIDQAEYVRFIRGAHLERLAEPHEPTTDIIA